jgi:hypothetical protein
VHSICPHRLSLAGLAAGLAALAASCGPARAPEAAPPGPAATAVEITAADLRARLSILADDSMQGRRAGTAGNVKGTDYIAREAKRIGLEPAGDSGSFFQTVPLVTRALDCASAVTVDGVTFRPWNDLIPRDQGTGARPIDGAQVIYGGRWGDSSDVMISPEQAAGKLVVITAARPQDGTPAGTVVRLAVSNRFATAAGIAVATMNAISPTDRAGLEENGAQLASVNGPPAPTFMYVTRRTATALLGGTGRQAEPGDPGRTVHGTIRFLNRAAPFPARNVVALLPGSDPALRGEYVAIGAHNDHNGIAPVPVDHDSIRAYNRVMRPQGANSPEGKPSAAQWARIRAILDSARKVSLPRLDSVLNGADDDGSGSVGTLEIAEQLARSPHRPKRSILFVWHTGEELGLLGSDWFTRHPTVPRDSIVAQLNMDMIGRGGATNTPNGGPAYLQIIGSRRLSTELGDLVERVNQEGKHGFVFDYSYDANGHPDNYYCRSDHYMYARFGIPITFFTTGAHLDYHQVTDEVQFEDYDKMARVASLVADVARHVGDLDHPVVVDKPKPDPEATCKQ